MKIIEVYRHTKGSSVKQLVSVACVIDGKRKTVPAKEWREMHEDSRNEFSFSEQEGVWPKE